MPSIIIRVVGVNQGQKKRGFTKTEKDLSTDIEGESQALRALKARLIALKILSSWGHEIRKGRGGELYMMRLSTTITKQRDFFSFVIFIDAKS